MCSVRTSRWFKDIAMGVFCLLTALLLIVSTVVGFITVRGLRSLDGVQVPPALMVGHYLGLAGGQQGSLAPHALLPHVLRCDCLVLAVRFASRHASWLLLACMRACRYRLCDASAGRHTHRHHERHVALSACSLHAGGSGVPQALPTWPDPEHDGCQAA